MRRSSYVLAGSFISLAGELTTIHWSAYADSFALKKCLRLGQVPTLGALSELWNNELHSFDFILFLNVHVTQAQIQLNLSRCHWEEVTDSQQVTGPPADTSPTWPHSLAFYLAALSIASPFDSVYLGLHNYNCALACIAIGGMFYALTWQTHLLSLACGMYLLQKGKTKIHAARQSMSSTGFRVNYRSAAKLGTTHEPFLWWHELSLDVQAATAERRAFRSR